MEYCEQQIVLAAQTDWPTGLHFTLSLFLFTNPSLTFFIFNCFTLSNEKMSEVRDSNHQTSLETNSMAMEKGFIVNSMFLNRTFATRAGVKSLETRVWSGLLERICWET